MTSQTFSYGLEKTENFRWAAKLFGAQSQHTLCSEDLVPVDLQLELSEIGQFAEVAHGHLSPDFIWQNLPSLVQPRFPLAGYTALLGSTLISSFTGTTANVQGYVARRATDLIIAFSGTSNFHQTINNTDIRQVSLPGHKGCRVHAGFLRLYSGVHSQALAVLTKALNEYEVDRIVFTGHSMGAAMCYLMLLNILDRNIEGLASKPITVATFGCPRVGNLVLVQRWREIIANHVGHDNAISEYAVKGYNDGVPSIPPQFLGYHLFANSPFYFVDGCLYRIPSSESEASFFKVSVDSAEHQERQNLLYPLGGHNYYNSRDMERVLRTMKLFSKTTDSEMYLAQVKTAENV
ncbi:hypothetical protein H0H93_003698 [Arthromyces matolae]|nr:hypothetical protein H0H93_003897 [Arthromyces matolae]KAG6835232.1 hypothetical protein H0H93_003698 [Arthromyces matolae]